jgi:hypothetical protein
VVAHTAPTFWRASLKSGQIVTGAGCYSAFERWREARLHPEKDVLRSRALVVADAVDRNEKWVAAASERVLRDASEELQATNSGERVIGELP